MIKRWLIWGGVVVAALSLSALCVAQSPAGRPPPANRPALQQPAEARSGHTLLELLQRGGIVMYPLYVCSILMVAFGIERAITLRHRKVIPLRIMQRIKTASASSDPAVRQKLLEEIQADESPMGRIVRAGYRRLDRPVLELEKAIEDAGAREAARMQRNNKVLSSVASIAPLLGLLGTVTGLMRSFMTVASNSEALGRTELLAAGIYEALVATAVGLSIAIASMALYFYYQERVDKLVGTIDDVAVDLLENLLTEVKPGGPR
ncbi:MAG: MotA/TolQ/ExbB proton channel family protein [bacterium]